MLPSFVLCRIFKSKDLNNTLTEKIVYILKNKNWLFLFANKCKGFIISDNPFILIPPIGFSSKATPGFLTPEVKITCPLSKNVCLQFIELGSLYNNWEIDQSYCDTINENIVKLSHRFIYSHKKYLLRKYTGNEIFSD